MDRAADRRIYGEASWRVVFWLVAVVIGCSALVAADKYLPRDVFNWVMAGVGLLVVVAWNVLGYIMRLKDHLARSKANEERARRAR